LNAAEHPAAAGTQDLARNHPFVLIVIGVVLYSTGPVMLQASSISGPAFSFWRLWIGAVILGVATWVQASGIGWPDARAWRYSLWSGLAFAGHQLLFFSAVKVTSVADVSLMNALAPLVTAVGAAWLFSEHPGHSFHRWSVLAIGGAIVIAVGGSGGPQGDPLGMTMAGLNVLAFAAFFLLSKKARDHLPVLPFLAGVMVVAALSVSLFVAVTGTPVTDATGRDLLLATAVAAGPGAIGHFVSTWPLRYVPATIPPVLRLAQPVLAGFLAFWLLSEPITGYHLIGGAVILIGVGGAMLSRGGRQLRQSARADRPATPLARASGGG
jgi:drug/metabolite transporter (DMT)-like permease